MRKVQLLLCAALSLSTSIASAQCTVNALSTSYDIICGQSVTLSHFGSTQGNISFSENFNSGSPTGWAFTQQATFSNPCSPGGADGTTHIWMGDNSGVPRSLITLPLNFGPAVAPAGGTICFDLLFSQQGDAAPCEGPDEPDEGVYLQYSTDNGSTWININYFDPNGGNDPQLVNWNNWCFEMPPGALVNGVQFRWFQDADSGSEYDHWGIDNVEIFVNDPTTLYTWVHDGYSTPSPGENPTPVAPQTTTNYTVNMTTATGNCSATVTVNVENPDVQVNAGTDQSVCAGDCITLNPTVTVVNDPGGIKTFANNQTETFDASVFGSASVNVNVQGLNMATVNPGSVVEVCITSLTFSGFGLPPGGVESISLTLVCPGGATVTLVPAGTAPAGPGGFFGQASSYQNACFVPSGGANLASVPSANATPITGTFNSSQPFTGVEGCIANGLWSIEVSTTALAGNGTFAGWSITFDDEIDEYTPDVLWSPTTYMAAGSETTLNPQVCPMGPITYTLSATDTAGCLTVTDQVAISIDNNCCETNTPPITGPAQVCANSTGNVYSVLNTPGSTYTWTVPAGAVITAGQGTSAITVTFGATGGDVTVVETINCGDGPPVTFAVTVTASAVLNITDPASVCAPATVDITAAAVTAGSTGVGTLTYWTDAGATAPLNNPNAVAATGTYYIQTGTGACAAIAPVTVTIDNCLSCAITGLGLSIADCYTANGFLQYDVDGNITYVDPPTTGTLTVTNCFGQQQVFNPPFGTTLDFTFTGLPQNGQECLFTAAFSDDPTCTSTTGIFAPPTITFFSSGCVIGSGVVSGTIEFTNPPATGTLVISIDDGTSTQQDVIQPPFSSPASWSVSGLDPTSDNYVITFFFSDYAGCAQSQSVICGCAAEAGSTTVSVNGLPTLAPVLCENDALTIETNGNFVHPDDEGPIGGFAYQPALVYLIYNCPPTVGMFPGDDPCLVGVIPVPENIGDVNDANSLVAQLPPGTFTNGQVYVAAITLYHFDPITPNFIVNANCWDLGTINTVTYLQPITSTVVESCPANTVTVTLNGGSPANNGSVFTASDLLPANAAFANTTAPDNGTIVINGLADGDMYSFDVTDANGCLHTVSGGPFTALPIADAGTDGTSCALTYQLAPGPSWGTGTWTGGPVGTTFAPNATTANATVTVPADGTYTFTWTEVNAPGCASSDDVEVTFAQMSIPAVVTGATCGETDGEVVVAPQGGATPYTYSWTSGGSGPLETGLGAGPVTVTVTDATGCSLDSTFVITLPAAFTFTTDATDVSCFGTCDGTASVAPVGVGPFTYQWSPSGGSGASAANLCAGSYDVEITEDAGCVQTTTIVIGTPTQVDAVVNSDETVLCIGQSAQLSASITGGTTPYGNFVWTATPADPTLQATQQDPAVSPVVTTTYSFVSQDANGCPSAPKEVTVTVLPPLTLDVTRPLAGGDTSICLHDLATIDLVAGGGDGNHSIFLMPDMTTPVTLPMQVQPGVTTTYSFIVTDGCTTPPASATSTITILPLPVVNFAGDDLEACDVHTVQFTDLTQPPAVQWAWTFGDDSSLSNTATVADPFHQFSGPGSYDIGLSVVTADGCAGDTVFPAYVTVHAVPTAQFDLSPSVVNLLNAHIDFTDHSQSDIATWAWDFGDGTASTATHPSHTYSDTGTFVITLNVTTIYGCTDRTEGVVIIEPDFTFYIPNAFTPNNNRNNEGFRPFGEGVDWSTYTLSIFTRWGEQIYYTVDIESPWDGSYKGSQVESGVYVYRIGITDLKGGEHEYTGKVTL
ncbi:MAG: gliding motility-associated C-terminal domain-containing protein, partial [Flavobacteriales bacterium]|nr:gliding motility-associated C-terminal domain-containing protein [Flavobacteriales bacterium]